MGKMELDITWASLWRIALTLGIVTILYFTRDVLITIFLSIVISAGLAPFIDYMENKGVPRLLGTLFIYISVGLLLGLLIYAILPIAFVELSSLFSNLVQLTGDIFNIASTDELITNFNKNLQTISNGLVAGGFSFLAAASSFFGGIFLALSVAVISFYLSLSKNGVEWFLRALLPEKHEERFINIFRRSKKRIGFWLQTQLLLSLVVGLMAFIGLSILGVRHAFILGLAAGVFEIVPFVGPVFAGSLAVLVALTDSFWLGVYVVALFVIIQQVESQLIIPSVFQKAIGLHPVVVIAAFMMGVTLLGFIGMIIAVPAAVILQEFLNDWISIKDHRRAMKQMSEEK